MKILITGSAGFIGSHLTDYLIREKGFKVVGIDNLSTGNIENVKRIESKYKDKYTFVKGDISNKDLMKDLLKQVSAVFHLAAQVSVVRSMENPLETNKINVTNFLEILEMCKDLKIADFIYPSSCSVYGDCPKEYLDENLKVYPSSIYASTKYLNELYSTNLSLFEEYPRIIGLRLFNVFGSWQDFKSGYAAVIPIWISRILKNMDPIIFGDGSTTRDFIHVSDVCEAFSQALNSNQSSGEIFNIGGGKSTSLNLLLKTIKDVLQEDFKFNTKNVIPTYKSFRPGEVKHSKANINKAKSGLNFSPKVSLENGIREIMINQYKLRKIIN